MDVLASEPQYLDHLRPLVVALDAQLFLTGRLLDQSVQGSSLRDMRANVDEPVLVASYNDFRIARQRGRPVIYLEHGAGQRYLGDPNVEPNPAYAGSPDHEGAVLFLTPRDEVSEWWRERYPDVPAVAVGCPKLDERLTAHAVYLDMTNEEERKTWRPADPIITLSFHSHLSVCPETTSAWFHYLEGLPKAVATLRDRGWTVWGHAHPRMWSYLWPRWKRMGVQLVEDFHQVLWESDVYAVDNSSTMYEFAAADMPVIALNCPAYRRDVEHGLRFWSHIPGIQCDGPEELVDKAELALEDPQEIREQRRNVTQFVYKYTDGTSTHRAAEAIRSLL